MACYKNTLFTVLLTTVITYYSRRTLIGCQ